MSDTDAEFLESLYNRPLTVSDRANVFILARRGVEAAGTITALKDRVKELEEGLRFYAAWPRTPSGNMAALLLDAGHKARTLLTPAPEKGKTRRTDARYNNAKRIFGDD